MTDQERKSLTEKLIKEYNEFDDPRHTFQCVVSDLIDMIDERDKRLSMLVKIVSALGAMTHDGMDKKIIAAYEKVFEE